MTFTIYAVPAMVGFLAKIGILAYGRRSPVRNQQLRLFLLVLASFAFLNVIEFTFFISDADYRSYIPDYYGRLWFASATMAVAFLLHFSVAVGVGTPQPDQRRFRVWTPMLIYTPAIALEALLWGGDLLIIDFERMAYTFTKVPGPLYFLWEIYVVGYFFGALGLLGFGAIRQPVQRARLQNRLLLTGFVPLVALGLAIIALQRIGFRGFNATATIPVTSTLLLIVAAYAIYRYRLVDVAFYIPWSRVRRQKIELYARLERLATEIRELKSPWDILERLAESLRCRVTLLGGPQPWSAAPRNERDGGERLLLAEFPQDALAKVDRIVTADEIAYTDRELHELMTRYKVGAIVPFRTHRTIPGYCLLLGQQFNEEIYSALDFKMVDRLFSAMARRFFEDFLLVRSQLEQVQEKLQGAKRNLMRTEQNVAGMRLKLTAARKHNRSLREELARLRRATFRLIGPESDQGPGQKSLEAYLAERERDALLSALYRAGGRRPAAARLLGIPLHALDRLLAHHGIDPDGPPDG